MPDPEHNFARARQRGTSGWYQPNGSKWSACQIPGKFGIGACLVNREGAIQLIRPSTAPEFYSRPHRWKLSRAEIRLRESLQLVSETQKRSASIHLWCSRAARLHQLTRQPGVLGVIEI